MTIVIDAADTGRHATDTVLSVGRGDDPAPAPPPSVTVVIAFFNEER
jgi:hypothetical protein